MQHFNIRIYGIWINDENEILVSDERINDFQFTKFPGGGLEFGEGIKDCLIREWREELNIEIDIIDHFYTTDFFQISAFNPNAQIISIYYKVKPIFTQEIMIDWAESAFDFKHQDREEIRFRKIPLSIFSKEDVTLPIDKLVADMIIKS